MSEIPGRADMLYPTSTVRFVPPSITLLNWSDLSPLSEGKQTICARSEYFAF
jgi:hypothetical protein